MKWGYILSTRKMTASKMQQYNRYKPHNVETPDRFIFLYFIWVSKYILHIISGNPQNLTTARSAGLMCGVRELGYTHMDHLLLM